MSYVEAVNWLDENPAWYNALTTNCTTTILRHVERLGYVVSFDWRMLANGHLDELEYTQGTISTAYPFEELRARSDVTARGVYQMGEEYARSWPTSSASSGISMPKRSLS